MSAHPAAGQLPTAADLTDLRKLVMDYFGQRPDPANPAQAVAFGTSGHRGTSGNGSFNEAHILAITQAICEFRQGAGIDGPMFLGMDTHALSAPAHASALEVLAANDVEVRIARDDEFTPTPAVSHAILTWNRGRERGLADGILITPSHNPPRDGGFKYNPSHGGPADTATTRWIEQRANELLATPAAIRRMTLEHALRTGRIRTHDYVAGYVTDLGAAIDFDAIRGAGLRLAVDPLGGAGMRFWPALAAYHRFDLDVLNPVLDPTFWFLRRDWDGQLRMDPSSPAVMQGVVEQAAGYDLVLACDADHDRHGIVARSGGLLPPNHFLVTAIDYLLCTRGEWPVTAAVGKTMVSSAMIDRVVARHGRRLHEVPVGFKWFVEGLHSGTLVFGGEESAGASFLRRNGEPWTTDKDGILLCLLAAEMTARTGADPAEHYARLGAELGVSCYARIDAPVTVEGKARLLRLVPEAVSARSLAGSPVTAIRTNAPGNGAALGGLKLETREGWFAARPSGTEDVYKIYAESFRDEHHLQALQAEARELVTRIIGD